MFTEVLFITEKYWRLGMPCGWLINRDSATWWDIVQPLKCEECNCDILLSEEKALTIIEVQ